MCSSIACCRCDFSIGTTSRLRGRYRLGPAAHREMALKTVILKLHSFDCGIRRASAAPSARATCAKRILPSATIRSMRRALVSRRFYVSRANYCSSGAEFVKCSGEAYSMRFAYDDADDSHVTMPG